MRGLLTRALETRGADPTLPWGNSYIPTNGQIGFVAAGVPMNDDSALAITTVATCINILADSVSTLPLKAYKQKSIGDRTKQEITPTPTVITNPWPEGTMQDWLTQVMVSLTLRGNFYGQIVDRDAMGFATTIMPIHPDRVWARRSNGDTGKRIYKVGGKLVDTADIVHIPAMLTPGQFIGVNPVEYQRQTWGLAAATEKYGGQFFANSANPSGYISVEQDLSPEETLELKRDWAQNHQGLANAQTAGVLTGGAEWHPISISPDDAQFLQTRTFQRDTIISWFRIPTHMMGPQDRTTSWGIGVEQQMISYVINTLMPWLSRIESHLSAIMRPSQVCQFDVSSRLRGDTLQRFQAYQIARNGGWLNVNEVRRKEDMPDIPDGNDYLQPLNMGLLGTDPTQAPPNDSGLDNNGGDGGASSQSGT